MHDFNWSNHKPDVDLIDGQPPDAAKKAPRHTRMFEAFLLFLDTQDIPDESSLHPTQLKWQLELDSQSNSQFEFVYYKLLASIDDLPDKVKHLVNFEDGLLIKLADKHLSNLLRQLVLIVDFDINVRRLAEEFSTLDVQSSVSKFDAVEKFYEEIFVASTEFTKYQRTKAREHETKQCEVVIPESEQQLAKLAVMKEIDEKLLSMGMSRGFFGESPPDSDQEVLEPDSKSRVRISKPSKPPVKTFKQSLTKSTRKSKQLVKNAIKPNYHCHICSYKSSERLQVRRHIGEVHKVLRTINSSETGFRKSQRFPRKAINKIPKILNDHRVPIL